MLDGRVTDRVEAEALTYNLQYIDVYSSSWGKIIVLLAFSANSYV